MQLDLVSVRGRSKLLAKAPKSPKIAFLQSVTSVKWVTEGCVFEPDYALALTLMQNFPDVEPTPSCRDWLRQFEHRERAMLELCQPKDVEGDPRLRDYQRIGARVLQRLKRVVLTDEPGLGKTAQAVCAVRDSGAHDRVLVLCPASLKFWWFDQVAEWTPKIPATIIKADSREDSWEQYIQVGGYLIVNWELVFRFPELQSTKWDWLIGDEAHRLRNRKTKTFTYTEKLEAERVALLTATPMANHPGEWWSYLRILNPQAFSSYWRFFELFVLYYEDRYAKRPLDVRNTDILRRVLTPYVLRRRKTQVNINLLPKKRRVIKLDLHKKQAPLYRDLAEKVWVELTDGTMLTVTSTLALITRFRQLVSTTATLCSDDYSSKLDALVELVQDNGDEPWVVFTQFRQTVHCVERRLKEIGVSCVTAMGGIPVGPAVKSFQAGDAQVFVATMQVGGVGITLTRAAQLVMVDKWFAPDVQEQAEDRIHRYGQTQQALITELRCPGTIDDLVEDILNRKIAMQSAVLGKSLRESLRGYLE